MTRTKTAALFAAMTLLMVASFALGSVLTGTAQAEGPSRSFTGTTLTQPGGPGTPLVPVWNGPIVSPEADPSSLLEDSSILCSITEGCDVPITFVTDEGEVVKTLVIRLEDPEPTATPAAGAGE